MYRNDDGAFQQIAAPRGDVREGAAAWGDYDRDGDLDVVLSGESADGPIARIHRNDAARPNMPPSSPTGLQTTADENGITFSWNAVTDEETPPAGLTYSVRVGTESGASDVLSAMSLEDGTRMVVRQGNAGPRTQLTLRGLD